MQTRPAFQLNSFMYISAESDPIVEGVTVLDFLTMGSIPRIQPKFFPT